MSRTRKTTNCAFCRRPFSITAVVKLFVEREETRPAPAPPLTNSQKEAGKTFVEACAHVGDEADEEETLQMVVR